RVLRADRGAPVPLAPARAGLGDRLAPTLAHLHHRAARLSAAAQLSFDDRSLPMFPAITFDHSFSPRRLGALLALSSAVMLPLAVPGLTAPAAAQAPAAPTLERVDDITHGPQLGNVTATSIRVWARTRQPGSFQV